MYREIAGYINYDEPTEPVLVIANNISLVTINKGVNHHETKIPYAVYMNNKSSFNVSESLEEIQALIEKEQSKVGLIKSSE
jgi:hypothetical protein